MVGGSVTQQLRELEGSALGYATKVRDTRLFLVAVAALVCLVDVGAKLLKPTQDYAYHQRSLDELALLLALAIIAGYLVPQVGSRSIALSVGLMVGAAVGNGLSIVAFSQGVPNPFTLASDAWLVAFNVADICAALGFLLLIPSVVVFARTHRAELSRPIGGSRSTSRRGARPARDLQPGATNRPCRCAPR